MCFFFLSHFVKCLQSNGLGFKGNAINIIVLFFSSSCLQWCVLDATQCLSRVGVDDHFFHYPIMSSFDYVLLLVSLYVWNDWFLFTFAFALCCIREVVDSQKKSN